MEEKDRYTEAVKKIREGLKPLQDGTKISGVTRAFLEGVFPELKESEDERIRKELIAEVKDQIDCIPAPDCRDKEDEKALKKLNKWLAWLEKQGEQKPEWSEEDERMHNTIVKDLEALCNMSKYERTKGFYNAEIDWLKAVRKRIGGEI